MGQAKRKELALIDAPTKAPAGQPFHTCQREQINLASLLLSRNVDATGRRRNDCAYREFGIVDLVEQMIDFREHDGVVGVPQKDWVGSEPIRIDVTDETRDYLIKAMGDATLQGAAGVILHGLEMRLKKLDADAYELPAELEAAGKQIAAAMNSAT